MSDPFRSLVVAGESWDPPLSVTFHDLYPLSVDPYLSLFSEPTPQFLDEWWDPDYAVDRARISKASRVEEVAPVVQRATLPVAPPLVLSLGAGGGLPLSSDVSREFPGLFLEPRLTRRWSPLTSNPLVVWFCFPPSDHGDSSDALTDLCTPLRRLEARDPDRLRGLSDPHDPLLLREGQVVRRLRALHKGEEQAVHHTAPRRM